MGDVAAGGKHPRGVAGQARPVRQPRALQGTPVMTSASGQRGDTVSKDNLRTPAEAAPERTTGCKPLGRKTNGSYPNRVLVVGRDGRPLDPCSPKRARVLLASKRARPVHGLPFAIRLLDRFEGDGRTVRTPDGRWVRGHAQISTVQGRVAVRTDTGQRSTNQPERVRKLGPKRGWAQKQEA